MAFLVFFVALSVCTLVHLLAPAQLLVCPLPITLWRPPAISYIMRAPLSPLPCLSR